ncbi:MAG: hypothetical protein M1816_002175 [Peltula sp. TS41687]|nr:MAG: hypothetical protein M1816_002175 [Peltula sp. TS41687]
MSDRDEGGASEDLKDGHVSAKLLGACFGPDPAGRCHGIRTSRGCHGLITWSSLGSALLSIRCGLLSKRRTYVGYLSLCLVYGLVQPALHRQKTLAERLQGIAVHDGSRPVDLVPGLQHFLAYAHPLEVCIIEEEMILGRGGEEVLHHVVTLSKDDPSPTQWIPLGQGDSSGGHVLRQVPMVYLTPQERVLPAVLEPSDLLLQATTSTHQRVGGTWPGGRLLDREVDPGLLAVQVVEVEKELELIESRLLTGDEADTPSA